MFRTNTNDFINQMVAEILLGSRCTGDGHCVILVTLRLTLTRGKNWGATTCRYLQLSYHRLGGCVVVGSLTSTQQPTDAHMAFTKNACSPDYWREDGTDVALNEQLFDMKDQLFPEVPLADLKAEAEIMKIELRQVREVTDKGERLYFKFT